MRSWKIFTVLLLVSCLLQSALLLHQYRSLQRMTDRVIELDIMQTIMGDWILHLNEQQRQNRI